LIEKQLFENNFISRRATARRLKNAAHLCDEKKKVVLVVSNLKTHG